MVDVIKFEPRRDKKADDVHPTVQILDAASNLDFTEVIVVGWCGPEGDQESRILTNMTKFSEIAWLLDGARYALLKMSEG